MRTYSSYSPSTYSSSYSSATYTPGRYTARATSLERTSTVSSSRYSSFDSPSSYIPGTRSLQLKAGLTGSSKPPGLPSGIDRSSASRYSSKRDYSSKPDTETSYSRWSGKETRERSTSRDYTPTRYRSDSINSDSGYSSSSRYGIKDLTARSDELKITDRIAAFEREPSRLHGGHELPARYCNGIVNGISSPESDDNGNGRQPVSELKRRYDRNYNSLCTSSSSEDEGKSTSSGSSTELKILRSPAGSDEYSPLPGRRAQRNSILYEENSSPRLSRRTSNKQSSGLVGLRNIGNTCFMNSVLQCLSNTKPLLEYIIDEQYTGDINKSTSSMKGALIKAFAVLLQELWTGETDCGRVVNTTSFKSQIQKFAPRFMGYSQQDAQEFLRYLLEGLHEDVNKVTVKPTPITTDIDDSYSDTQKAIESWKRYLRYDNSKIVDLFVGQLKSMLTCTDCGHSSVTFDPFWDLSLSIPSRTGSVKLQQCFDLFTREEILDGEEKPTCSQCKQRKKCTKSFTIHKLPPILVIHLKRFSPGERYRAKLSCSVDYPVTSLDLSPYTHNKQQPTVYNLYGVANHSGTTYSGHYTASCKHPYSAEWYEYNDSRVTKTSKAGLSSSEGYVLFYEHAGRLSM